MEEKRPEIRFKGFEDQWMQQTFAESFAFLKNNTLSREELHTDGLAENIHYGDILIRFEECINAQKELLPKISNDKLIQKLKTSYLQDGDVIIADTAEDETVGKCSEINNIGNKIVVSGLHTMPCRPKGKYEDGYLGYYMNSPSYHNQLFPLMQGTKVTSISKNAISETKISFPVSELEQGMISQFFQKTTSLITLTQQKLDQLKTLKKACLEKMFPKEGETVPEIRFKGFEGPWKQCKLHELSSVITKGTTPIDKSGIGDVNFVKIENIDSSSGEIKNLSKITQAEHLGNLKRSQLHENDILFSIAGTLGRVTSVPTSILPANTNQALAIIRLKECNTDFITIFLKGKAVKDFILKNPTVGAQPNLSLAQVANLDICIPNKEEQNVLACLFKRLDTIINYQYQKLSQLKTLKQACLEKMFV